MYEHLRSMWMRGLLTVAALNAAVARHWSTSEQAESIKGAPNGG